MTSTNQVSESFCKHLIDEKGWIASLAIIIGSMGREKLDTFPIVQCGHVFSSMYHQTFQVPKMEESSPIKAVCKAYVRENPPSK